MNILVPDSWLREFLETNAGPGQTAEALSLCSASVEKLEKSGHDYIYDIEITTNRVDMLSIIGIAREAAAVLPRFGFKAKFKKPLNRLAIKPPALPSGRFSHLTNDYLAVKITEPSLCPRFTTVLLNNITIHSSPVIIKQRLKKSGIRPLNNVVDISNYVMLETGQPLHVFDYDSIKKQTMTLRESRVGEKIQTLDGQIHQLPPGAIIIEDGENRLIDLCGIMGGQNTAVSAKTKRVLLFVQGYDPVRIRKTCQSLAFRTPASTRFEKGISAEAVLPALNRAVRLLQKNAGAKIAGAIIDIYPKPYQPKTISLDLNLVKKIIGIEIKKDEVIAILKSLNFPLFTAHNSLLTFNIPSFRTNDINIPQDLIEEIARIYGYHNLPSSLPSGEIPQKNKTQEFFWETKVKETLKHWGFNEIYNYSMVSNELLNKCGLPPSKCLKIANPLTVDWLYMRPSLIPSILQNIANNLAYDEHLKLFELAKIYIPQKNDLPDEIFMLTIAMANANFYETKGIAEGLLQELGIRNYDINANINNQCPIAKLIHPFRSGAITSKQSSHLTIGYVGQIHPAILNKFSLRQKVNIIDINFSLLVKHATLSKKYIHPSKYPSIINDLTVISENKLYTSKIYWEILSTNPLVQSVKLIDSFHNSRTFRITFHSDKKTLTDHEVGRVREKIIKKLKEKLGIKVKKKLQV